MKKLYKILTRHCSPKDYSDSIYGYVLADDELDILHYLNKVCVFGNWQDKSDEDGMIEIYNDNYDVVGAETYMEYLLRIRGDYNDEDADWSDAYYGLTFYGWEEGIDVTEDEMKVLRKLDIITVTLPLFYFAEN